MSMNIQPGRMQSKRSGKKNPSGSFSRYMRGLGKAVLLVLAVAAVRIAETRLHQKIDDINAKIREEKREIGRARHAIESCDIKIAQRTDWNYISLQIARFNLKLRPQQGQVRMIDLRNSAANDARFAAWLKNRRDFPSMTAAR